MQCVNLVPLPVPSVQSVGLKLQIGFLSLLETPFQVLKLWWKVGGCFIVNSHSILQICINSEVTTCNKVLTFLPLFVGGFSSHLWNSLSQNNSLNWSTVCNVNSIPFFSPLIYQSTVNKKDTGDKGHGRILFELRELLLSTVWSPCTSTVVYREHYCSHNVVSCK